jgi:hypothetical protein
VIVGVWLSLVLTAGEGASIGKNVVVARHVRSRIAEGCVSGITFESK